jgi:hypothetical protein
MLPIPDYGRIQREDDLHDRLNTDISHFSEVLGQSLLSFNAVRLQEAYLTYRQELLTHYQFPTKVGFLKLTGNRLECLQQIRDAKLVPMSLLEKDAARKKGISFFNSGDWFVNLTPEQLSILGMLSNLPMKYELPKFFVNFKHFIDVLEGRDRALVKISKSLNYTVIKVMGFSLEEMREIVKTDIANYSALVQAPGSDITDLSAIFRDATAAIERRWEYNKLNEIAIRLIDKKKVQEAAAARSGISTPPPKIIEKLTDEAVLANIKWS